MAVPLFPSSEERPLHNLRLLERFKALEDFGTSDQEAVITILYAVIVNKRVEGATKPLEKQGR